MVTYLPYRRSMCSFPLPHHGDFVFGSLDHWGSWHRWNFKQSQRSLWDWVPRPKTCVVIGRPRCCLFEALFRCTAKVECILQSCRDLTLTFVMGNWMQVFNIQCHVTEKIGSIISKFIKMFLETFAIAHSTTFKSFKRIVIEVVWPLTNTSAKPKFVIWFYDNWT